jgi:hypothetical protein
MDDGEYSWRDRSDCDAHGESAVTVKLDILQLR